MTTHYWNEDNLVPRLRIMVTGSEGFIGQHLCSELGDAGHGVYHVDIALSQYSDMRVRNYADSVLDHYRPDVVVHLAAQVGRQFGEDDVRHSVDSNAGMTATVAQACGERGVRLVYASTSEVYGDVGNHVCDEDFEYEFRKVHNIYGLSKRWGEEVCRLYAPDGLTILRFSMPYGPGLPAGRGRAAMINFLYNALHDQPITVHRNSERSWCYIADTVRAARMIIEQTSGGVFNVGRDDNAEPLRVTAERACDLVGASHDLIVDVDPPARQTVVKRLSTQKIRDLGWTPEVSLEEGMALTLEFVKDLAPPVAVAA